MAQRRPGAGPCTHPALTSVTFFALSPVLRMGLNTAHSWQHGERDWEALAVPKHSRDRDKDSGRPGGCCEMRLWLNHLGCIGA